MFLKVNDNNELQLKFSEPYTNIKATIDLLGNI